MHNDKNFPEHYTYFPICIPSMSLSAISTINVHYNARQEGEAKDLLKRFKEHLSKAKLERNYYNKNTKLAEEQRKLVDQNYSKSKTQYCSVDATAHYGYDRAQNVHVPHSDQQVSKIYSIN